MAGFKNTLIDMDPICLLSFDGMRVKENGLHFNGDDVIDEMGNFKGTLIQETDKEITPCAFAATGLSPDDIYEQKSIRFCPTGMQWQTFNRGEGSLFPKGYIRAQCTNMGELWNTGKEMTYMFQIKRDYSQIAWTRTATRIVQKNVGGILQDVEETYTVDVASNYTDPILQHVGIITITETLHRYYGTFNTINIEFDWLIGWQSKKITLTNVDLFGRENRLANLITVRVKDNHLQIFKNLELIYSSDEEYYSLWSDTRSGTVQDNKKNITHLSTDPRWRNENELFIGGLPNSTGTPDATFSDRCCIPTTIDNVALFNYALTDAQIIQLYRRMFSFDDLILKSAPLVYCPCEDFAEGNTQLMSQGTAGKSGGLVIVGPLQPVSFRESGPLKLRRSILFNGKNALRRTNSSPLFDPTRDFSFFMHFKYNNPSRSCLLYQGTLNPHFGGISVWLNSRNGQYENGSIEIISPGNQSITLGTSVDSEKWHSIAIIQRKNYIYAWLDSRRAAFGNVRFEYDTLDSSNQIAQGYLLTGPFEQEPTSAYISDVVIWNSAVSPLFIESLNEYESIYYIKGTIRYEGEPYRAKVRAYNHISGELINETWSDSNEGFYVLYLKSDEPIDLMVIDDRDIMSKVMSYGPIIPYMKEFDIYNP